MENNSHREIREGLINKLVLLLSIFAIPATMLSSYRSVDIGLQPLFVIQSIATLIMIVVAFFRKSLPYAIKITSLLLLLYLLGTASSINFGLAGFITEYLMLAILFGVVFLGKKWALIIFTTSFVIILTIAVLTTKGIVSPVVSIDAYALHLSSWIGILTGFGMVAALAIIVVGEIGYSLSDKMTELKKKNDELKIAHDAINRLQGIIPICAQCKKIRDSEGYWSQVESYIEKHSEAKFSHGICEQCADELYGDQKWYQKSKLKKK